MSRYIVTFERIGRSRDVPPLDTVAETADELAESVFDYARPRLGSRYPEVFVNLETGVGFIVVGGAGNGGTLSIAAACNACGDALGDLLDSHCPDCASDAVQDVLDDRAWQTFKESDDYR